MAEVEPQGGRPVEVRFLAGGRADETPAAILLDGQWRAVRLIGAERVASPEPGSPLTWRYRLEDEAGRRHTLVGGGGWPWRLAD